MWCIDYTGKLKNIKIPLGETGIHNVYGNFTIIHIAYEVFSNDFFDVEPVEAIFIVKVQNGILHIDRDLIKLDILNF